MTIPKTGSPALVEQLQILSAQISDLTSATFELDAVTRARAQLTRTAGPGEARLAAEAQPVTVKIKKKSGPQFVSVRLVDTDAPILDPYQTDGRPIQSYVGAEIDIFIVVKGNPGERAVLEVSNAVPKLIQMSAFPGETGNQGTRTLVVVG